MKKIFKHFPALLLICILCAVFPGRTALADSQTSVISVFTDIEADTWYTDSVQYVYDQSIMTGMSEGIFGPFSQLSRAQFAVILYRMEKTPAVTYTNKFPDIDEGLWYSDAVIWANQCGIVTGYENGLFGPADHITREQMAVMMYRYAVYKGFDVSVTAPLDGFLDHDNVSGFASDAMVWAVGSSIITGKQDGTRLDPQGNATRAECAVIISRFMDQYETTGRGSDASIFYRKLLAGEDVKILIVGDSIGVSSIGCSSRENHWSSLLKDWLQTGLGVNADITNVSMGGSTSYAGYVNIMREDSSENYDLVILCYGQNDYMDNFSMYYENLIRSSMQKFPDCTIISILESSQRTYTPKIQMIQSLCEYYGIPAADTIAAYNDSGIDYSILSEDGVHPSDPGQELYFETLQQVITDGLENGSPAPTAADPVNPGTESFINFVWYSAETDFNRIDDTTFELPVNIAGSMGMEFMYKTGNSNGTFYADDELIPSPTLSFTQNIKLNYITPVADLCSISGVLRITFDDKEQADGFGGVAFNW